MRGGEKRKNNLILLAESAKQFEKNGYKGVFGFLRFVRNLQDRDIELTSGANDKGSASDKFDSVKIMSIHKSKGLEFPVVILANTSKQSNFQEIRKNVVFHTDLGIGAMLTDKKRRIRYTTLARTAIQSKLNDEMQSEELRVLYVAMTRAREKLIITAALRNAERTKEKISLLPTGVVAPQAVLTLRSMIEWILVGVRSIEDSELVINYMDAKGAESVDDNLPVEETQLESLSVSKAATELQLNADQKNAKASGLEFEFLYPFEAAVDLPSKLTVTGLKSLQDPEAEAAPWVRDIEKDSFSYPLPSFISGKKEMTAADRGTLLHLVMQHIDYKKCSYEHEEKNVRKELQRLNSCGIISDEQVSEIDTSKIVNLFSSALGVRMISAKKLEREFKISILRPAEDYFPGGGSDKILLQGVVDCYFEEDDEIVVVDFKTDRVTNKTVDKIAQLYSQQLNAYADALYNITGKRVKERIIYFFSIDRAYTIE
jgi:ATP-dependent helicase/nuclease subunit A